MTKRPASSAAPMARLAAIAAALALAYGAQVLFDHPDQPVTLLARLPRFLRTDVRLPSLLLVAAMAVFAAAAPRLPAAAPGMIPNRPSREGARRPGTLQPSHILAICALVLYLANLVLYLVAGESALVRLLWLTSPVLLLISQARPGDGHRLATRWRRDWRLYLLPASLLLLALGLRLFQLTTIPQDLHGDMASHGLQARAIVEGRSGGLVGVGWADIPMPGFLPAAITMIASGDVGLLGLNLASVVGGVLSLWGLYLLLNEMLDRRIALIATALLAVSYTHIHFSRIAEYMDPVPFIVWALLMLILGLRTGRQLPFLLSGILLGGATLMYYSGRVGLVATGLFLLYLLAVDRRQLQANRWGLALLAVGFAVALGPMLIYFLQHGEQFLSRSRDVVLTNPEVVIHLENKYGVQGFLPVLGEQVKRSLLMFSYAIDSSTQFGFPRPMVDSITGPLVALGFAFGLRHWRQRGLALLVILLATLLILGSVLTNNAPFWPRLVLILLPATALAAVAVDRVWAATVTAFGPETDRMVAVVVVGGLIFVGLQNWLLYYPAVAHNGRPRALVGRFVASLPAAATVCLVPEAPEGWLHSLGEREIIFFMGERQWHDVPATRLAEGLAGDDPCAQPGTAWIVPQAEREALQRLQEQFGDNTPQAQGPRRGIVTFYAYEVPEPG